MSCCLVLPDAQVPVDSPERFFVEIQFSNGANFDPTTTVPTLKNHTLPTQVTQNEQPPPPLRIPTSSGANCHRLRGHDKAQGGQQNRWMSFQQAAML
jgi:hypothetical protein